MIRVFETRISKEEAPLGKALEAYAHLMSKAERKIHAYLMAGNEWTADKFSYLYKDLGLTSVMFRSVKTSYDAKVDAARELTKLNIASLETKIRAKQKQIGDKTKDNNSASGKIAKVSDKLDALSVKITVQKAKLDAVPAVKAERREKVLLALKKLLDKADMFRAEIKANKKLIKSNKRDLHQHKRRLKTLNEKLGQAQYRLEHPSLAFGSKKLFKKQFHLKENSYKSHEEWLSDWKNTRKSSFFLVGAERAPTGNDVVRLHLRDNGNFDLELRLPSSLSGFASETKVVSGREINSITFHGLHFNHGHSAIAEALATGQPLSYRFIRDEVSWKVTITVDEALEDLGALDWSFGALGVDLNADHVAVFLVDGYGNPINTWRFDFDIQGKSSGQNQDALRKIAKQVAILAKHYGVPVVSERLDFAKKKDQLETAFGRSYARMLSSFAYSAFDAALASACARNAVHLRRVNPAYTSLIGRTKFARRYGLSVHAAAAVSIARRAMGLSERVPVSVEGDVKVPLNNGDLVTLASPARKNARHVWSYWSSLNREYKKATSRARALGGRGGVTSTSEDRNGSSSDRRSRPSGRRAVVSPSSLSVTGVDPAAERILAGQGLPG